MCGISGIHVYRNGRVDRRELQSMCDALAHRGPDGSGLWIDDAQRIALAHRRLAIIDLSERGAQPMHSSDEQLSISFNGEIYNHRELRQALEKRGRRFDSDSDTEVLLHLYAEHGEAMLAMLRGMFAFILVDRRTGRTLLARDPYGIKPLYLADDGQVARIASEVKALERVHAAGAVRPAARVAFLMLGSVPEPYCWRERVRAVPAGHSIWIGDSGPEAARRFASITHVWYEAAHTVSGPSMAADAVTCDALRDSVAHHLVSDVPVGAFLSGGVDSAALVGLIRETQGDVRTVTITTESFRGTAADEAPGAERMARQYGAVHETHVITGPEFKAVVPQILHDMDQPSIDGFNVWLVSRAAVRAGLKVAVSGLGADELFGGYPSFTDLPRWHAIAGWSTRVPWLGQAVRRATVGLDAARRIGVSPKLAGLFELGGSYPGAYLLRRGLFMPWELPALIGDEQARAGLLDFDPIAHVASALVPDPRDAFARVAALEASLYMRNQLLRDADWASMAHGLEVRVPFVDYTLLKRLAPVAAGSRGGAGKRILAGCPRKAVPNDVVARSKTGFGLPMATWLADSPEGLDSWRRVPSLARAGVHWSRRMAFALSEART